MYISFGSIGFRPLHSKMIRVHAIALCLKKIKNSLIRKEICQSSRELMEMYFLPLFSAESCSYGIPARSSEVRRSFIFQVSV